LTGRQIMLLLCRFYEYHKIDKLFIEQSFSEAIFVFLMKKSY